MTAVSARFRGGREICSDLVCFVQRMCERTPLETLGVVRSGDMIASESARKRVILAGFVGLARSIIDGKSFGPEPWRALLRGFHNAALPRKKNPLSAHLGNASPDLWYLVFEEEPNVLHVYFHERHIEPLRPPPPLFQDPITTMVPAVPVSCLPDDACASPTVDMMSLVDYVCPMSKEDAAAFLERHDTSSRTTPRCSNATFDSSTDTSDPDTARDALLMSLAHPGSEIPGSANSDVLAEPAGSAREEKATRATEAASRAGTIKVGQYEVEIPEDDEGGWYVYDFTKRDSKGDKASSSPSFSQSSPPRRISDAKGTSVMVRRCDLGGDVSNKIPFPLRREHNDPWYVINASGDPPSEYVGIPTQEIPAAIHLPRESPSDVPPLTIDCEAAKVGNGKMIAFYVLDHKEYLSHSHNISGCVFVLPCPNPEDIDDESSAVEFDYSSLDLLAEQNSPIAEISVECGTSTTVILPGQVPITVRWSRSVIIRRSKGSKTTSSFKVYYIRHGNMTWRASTYAIPQPRPKGSFSSDVIRVVADRLYDGPFYDWLVGVAIEKALCDTKGLSESQRQHTIDSFYRSRLPSRNVDCHIWERFKCWERLLKCPTRARGGLQSASYDVKPLTWDWLNSNILKWCPKLDISRVYHSLQDQVRVLHGRLTANSDRRLGASKASAARPFDPASTTPAPPLFFGPAQGQPQRHSGAEFPNGRPAVGPPTDLASLGDEKKRAACEIGNICTPTLNDPNNPHSVAARILSQLSSSKGADRKNLDSSSREKGAKGGPKRKKSKNAKGPPRKRRAFIAFKSRRNEEIDGIFDDSEDSCSS